MPSPLAGPIGHDPAPAGLTAMSCSRRAARWSWALVALAGATTLLGATPARACGPCESSPRLLSRTMKPGPGTSGVPLNAGVWVRHEFSSFRMPTTAHLLLRAKDGKPVEVESRTVPQIAPLDRCYQRSLVVLRPRAPLQPDTTYEVLEQAPATVGPDGGPPTPEVIGTFVTGQAEDHEPPRFMGVRRWEKGLIDDCDSSACCGPYRAARFSVEADPAWDAQGLVGYEVTVGGKLVDLIDAPQLEGWTFCSGTAVKGPHGAGRPVGRHRFNAVDLAGNRDSNTVEVDVVLACGAGQNAADSGVGADAGAGAGGGGDSDGGGAAPATARSSRGCAHGSHGRAGVPAILLLALLVLASVRAARHG